MNRINVILSSGLIFLLITIIANWPIHFLQIEWVEILVLTAVLFWVPFAIQHTPSLPYSIVALLLCNASLAISFLLPSGIWAGILSLPWLLFTSILFLTKLNLYSLHKHAFLSIAYLFLVIGAAWATAYAFNYKPLSFHSNIVVLTAAHFHYAGFLLLFLMAKLYLKTPTQFKRIIAITIIIGMVTVAIAITYTKMTGWLTGESISGSIMFIAGTLVAIEYFRASLNETGTRRVLWSSASFVLIIGMFLALGYALRPFLHIQFLNIPNMYALHGSGNAFAIGMLILGWMTNKNV